MSLNPTLNNPSIARDLFWSLRRHKAPERACRLMTRVRHGLAVYSRTVEKIYTKYSVYQTNAQQSIVILPDFNAYHDMIHHISHEAIEPTGIRIILGEAIGKPGLWVMGKLQGRKSASALPLPLAVKAMRMGAYSEGRLLPILQYGDLREMTRMQLPYLHLHRVRLERLSRLSQFDRDMVAKAIERRLDKLAQVNQDNL